MRVRRSVEQMVQYQPGRPQEEIRRLYGLERVIKLASNENPFGPSPRAIEALQAAAQAAHLYPETAAPVLRAELAARLGLEPERIIVGNGSDEIMRLLGQAFLNPGDEVVSPHPSFPNYDHIAKLMDATTVFSPLRDGRPDVEGLAAAVTPRTRIVFVCSPNNPTGGVVTRDELAWLLGAVREDVLIALDAAYIEYVEPEADAATGLEWLDRYPNLVVLRTFSKIYGLAGLRLGYACADAGIVRTLLRVREPFSVNRPAQAAGLAALADDGHVEMTQRLTWQEKARFYTLCERLGLPYQPSQANFVLVRIGPDCPQFVERLLGRGLIVRPGNGWGLPEWIRVSLGTPEEMDMLAAAFKECLA